MPSSDLRHRLRGAGHALDPVVHIGKQGASDGVIEQVGRALLDHELIKVKIGGECPETRFELAELFAGLPGVKVAQILGRNLLLYKRNAKKPKFERPDEVAPKSSGRPARIPGKR